ncbi:MAG: hypothetical protein MZU97_11155 [Bacillus subtilis]|nr:hypothetical protein [Bacillus subtilis]
MILVHNHPSGDPEPSPHDIDVTKKFREIGELLGIRLADHVVVAGDRYVSIGELVETVVFGPGPFFRLRVRDITVKSREVVRRCAAGSSSASCARSARATGR